MLRVIGVSYLSAPKLIRRWAESKGHITTITMASQTSATAFPQKNQSQRSQTKSKDYTRAPRGEGFDLRGRQRRIAREQNDQRKSKEAQKRNEELIGRRLQALSEKYIQELDRQEEEGKKRKGGRGMPLPLFGGGGGVKVDTEGVQFRSNEEALPTRRYPEAPRKQQTQRRRPVGAEFDATAAAFGPALCGSGPALAPKLPVIWGPGMNPPPPPKSKNVEPKEPKQTETAAAALPAKQPSPINYAAMTAKPPTPSRSQTPNDLPTTTPLATATPTNDVWGAETDEDDDDDDMDEKILPGQAWGSV